MKYEVQTSVALLRYLSLLTRGHKPRAPVAAVMTTESLIVTTLHEVYSKGRSFLYLTSYTVRQIQTARHQWVLFPNRWVQAASIDSGLKYAARIRT